MKNKNSFFSNLLLLSSITVYRHLYPFAKGAPYVITIKDFLILWYLIGSWVSMGRNICRVFFYTCLSKVENHILVYTKQRNISWYNLYNSWIHAWFQLLYLNCSIDSYKALSIQLVYSEYTIAIICYTTVIIYLVIWPTLVKISQKILIKNQILQKLNQMIKANCNQLVFL